MAKAKETHEARNEESRQRESTLAPAGTGELSRDFGGFRYATPFSFMKRFSEEMDRLFEDVGFGSSWLARPFNRNEFPSFAWSPQIETFQRDNEFVLRADLPGLNKDDLKVSLDDNCLAIQGERKKEWSSDQESAGRYRSERSYGSFYRCIQLPQGVRAENVKATFRDGVLEVKVPAPEQTQARRVEITS